MCCEKCGNELPENETVCPCCEEQPQEAIEELLADTSDEMQQEPIFILGAIGSHFRRLATARTLLDHGKTSAELMRLCGMADYPARKTMDAARRFPAEFCAKAAELVMETDYRMKTSFDDPDRLLELLILQLAQEARRG